MICLVKFEGQIGHPHLVQEDPSANDSLGRHAEKWQLRRLFLGRCEMPMNISAYSSNGDSMAVLLRWGSLEVRDVPGEIQPKKSTQMHSLSLVDHVDVIDFGDFTATWDMIWEKIATIGAPCRNPKGILEARSTWTLAVSWQPPAPGGKIVLHFVSRADTLKHCKHPVANPSHRHGLCFQV